MQALIQIKAATLAARQRLADSAISTRADAGKIQVVRVKHVDGKTSDIAPVSGWMPVADVCGYLAAMQ